MTRWTAQPPARVLHLIKGLGRGGAETLLVQGLRTVDRERFTFGYGYFLPWKDALVPDLRAQGADVVCFARPGPLRIALSARRVAAFAEAWKADVIHCHLPLTGAVGRLAGALSGIPVVYTEHNKLERYHPLTRRLSLATWSMQRTVVAVSSEVATSIQRHVQRPIPVRVVRNGVDAAHFDPQIVDSTAARHSLKLPPGALVVGTVAVFRQQKRLDSWLDAAVIIRQAIPDAQFLIVGDGPLRQPLIEQVESTGLQHCTHLAGLQDDVRPYLAVMDVYMMSSIVEGLPVALLEAMAMQRAIVATDVGGIPEVVSSGDNGITVPPLQPDALASACIRLLRSPEARKALGLAARATVLHDFSVQRMTRDLESIYTSCLLRGQPAES